MSKYNAQQFFNDQSFEDYVPQIVPDTDSVTTRQLRVNWTRIEQDLCTERMALGIELATLIEQEICTQLQTHEFENVNNN